MLPRPGSALSDRMGTALVDESYSAEDPSYGLGLGQNSMLLRDPQVQQVATTRDDLAVRRLTDSSAGLFARVPVATTTALVYRDAIKTRTDTSSILRPTSMRPIGPDDAWYDATEFQDRQFHPTAAASSKSASLGQVGAWRYPFTDVGTVGAAGVLTSQLNYQENMTVQRELRAHSVAQREVPMPGATQMYDAPGNEIFGTQGRNIAGTAPAAQVQGILSVAPASGAVVRGNDYNEKDALAALDGIEDISIQAERVLAQDNMMARIRGYSDVDQFDGLG